MEDYGAKEWITICIGAALVIGWLISVYIWLQRLFKNYTFKNWGIQVNPYQKETLGMPRGTLRGILTLTLLIVFILFVAMSMIIPDFRGSFKDVSNAFQVMLAFYFGSKVMHHVTSTDREKTKQKAEAEKVKARVQAQDPATFETTEFDVVNSKG